MRRLDVKTPRPGGARGVEGKAEATNLRANPATHCAMATEINQLHFRAIDSATRAVDCAKKAGELLLQVKADLLHGEFLPWLVSNVLVTERQAQRYMRAAQGKPITPRAIAAKYDTVSYLPERKPWLPADGVAYIEFSAEEFLFVQESADAPGFFYAAFAGGGAIDFTIKPMRGEFIERAILGWLPGRLLQGRTVAGLPWLISAEVDMHSVRNMIEPHLPDGYGHLKRREQAIGQIGGA